MAQLTTSSLDAALRPVVTMLEADGYGLDVELVGERLHVTVSAGPQACKECLVPKPVLANVLRSTLGKAGIAVDAAAIDVTYPVEAEHA